MRKTFREKHQIHTYFLSRNFSTSYLINEYALDLLSSALKSTKKNDTEITGMEYKIFPNKRRYCIYGWKSKEIKKWLEEFPYVLRIKTILKKRS